ncbi:MAG: T9SS type A sorting domain-containing protein [Bacteroidales bacterium]|nr:T9SS type A sorting domain-containing protein [Bacteroidales bacterium]
MRLHALINYLLEKRLLAFLAGLMILSALSAQWRQVQFDDSDMALDLTEAFTFQKYPTYHQYVEMMQTYAQDYPGICRLDTFGTSVNGRLLLALKISDNPELAEPEANFLYSSTMHGDELVGYVLMLRLAGHLLKGYGTDPEVTGLVDSLSIWINPLANPDGSYSQDNNLSLKNSTRRNADGIDLNRDFPDPSKAESGDTTGRTRENQAMMHFMKKNGFTLSANIHSGAEVVNYPWDHTYDLHADDPWYRFVSREYADEARAVDPGYMSDWVDGITNGAQWYRIYGGRQDYVNYYLEGREVTLELSNAYRLGSDYLEEFWDKNERSLLNYMAQSMYGIRGRISDRESGDLVSARIFIPGHDNASSVVHSFADHGDFYRLIREGVYDVVVSAQGYLNDTLRGVTVTDYTATYLDIRLEMDPKAGLTSELSAAGFRLYPNPASSRLIVEPHHVQPGPLEMKVISTDGQLHWHRTFYYAGHPVTLNTEALPEGLYILRINSAELSRSIRFIKQ